MICIGITKKFKRCGNNCRFLFCRHHRCQPITLLVSLGLAIIFITDFSESIGLKKPIDLLLHSNNDSLSYNYNKQVEQFKGMLSPKIVVELSPDKNKMRYYYHIENLGEITAYEVLYSSVGPGIALQMEKAAPIKRNLFKNDSQDYIPYTVTTFIDLPESQNLKFLLWINYKVKIDGKLKEFICLYQKIMRVEELNSKSYTFDYGNCEENFISPESIFQDLLERNEQNKGEVNKIKNDISKDFKNDLNTFNFNSLPYQEENNGFSIHLVLKLGQNSLLSDHYIIDMGDQNKNRISLYLNVNNKLVFRIIDNYSNKYEATISEDNLKLSERYNYINFEFGLNNKYSFLKILINGKELIKNKYNYMIPFNVKLKENIPIVIGADLNYRNHANFSIAEIIMYDSTISNNYKNNLLIYTFTKEGRLPIFFDGNDSMSNKQLIKSK